MVRAIKEGLLPLAAAVAMGLGVGWWAHGGVRVQASSPAAPTEFLLNGTGSATTLTVYYPNERTLYLYPAMAGSSNIACTYRFKIGEEGQQIERENCPAGKLY